jgi:hypothetical protein
MGNLSFEPEGRMKDMPNGWLSLSTDPFKSRRAQLSANCRHSGARAQREPGNHAPGAWLWIPGLRQGRIPE